MKRIYRAEDTRVPPSRISPEEPASLLEDLALHVNLGDQLRVEDQSGGWTTGRLTGVADEALTVHTPDGDRRFTRAQADVAVLPMHNGAADGIVLRRR
jgi:hypothetical protein